MYIRPSNQMALLIAKYYIHIFFFEVLIKQ